MPKEYLYFFHPYDLFQSILRSRLVRKMHFSFGDFRNDPIEPWQSLIWTEFVRTTSGQLEQYHYSKYFPLQTHE